MIVYVFLCYYVTIHINIISKLLKYSMNIAFWDNCLCERGTTVCMFDYAYYNQTILNNKTFIFYLNTRPDNKP